MPSPRPCRLSLLLLAILVAALPTGSAVAEESRPLNFANDIVPIFTRHGCNNSTCHGKAEGQNGFKLSVFGFDPEGDYRALLMEGRGRRAFPAAADHSLLLLKASGGVPHGGGVRIDPHGPEYDTLRRWIAEGARYGSPDDPRLIDLHVTPSRRQMTFRERVQLRTEAIWSDGRREDVTRLATFQSNNDALVTVDPEGRAVTGEAPGTAAVMASYLGHVDVLEVVIPRPQPLTADPASWPEANRIDTLVHRRLAELRIEPSGRCDDATYLRRVHLDLIGTLPTIEETEAFLADERPDRRRLLVQRLLERPEYADYWSQQWADLLRVNRRVLGRKRAHQLYRWIHQAVASNTPLDQLAREVIAAEGPLRESPAGLFYRSVSKPDEMASTVSQVFLGVRIQCAQCHHHPWDRWGQEDYFAMQAVFAEVAFKTAARGDTLAPRSSPKTLHPRTREPVAPRPLGSDQPLEETARREQLARWMTSPDNPWFARNMANRLWARLLGRGLVEPVDDFRSTNPPSHGELLDHLASELIDSGYDAKHLLRLIVASETYQRSTSPTDSNRDDEHNFSRYPLKRLPAEVLLDAVCQVTEVPEKFEGLPPGSRAIQLWDSHVPHYFLRLFGRPQRETACECERVVEPNVSQVLHVLNSPQIHGKLAHQRGRVARLARECEDDGQLAERLFLVCFSRPPSDDERAAAVAHLRQSEDRQRAAEDLAWSLINTLEFALNH